MLAEKVEVVEGRRHRSQVWALIPEVPARFGKDLDLIINSSGLTDFNPDLRDALAANVDAPIT